MADMSADAVSFYVSPAGDDAHDGRSPEKAVRSLHRARDLVREALRQPGGPVTVQLAGGRYVLDQTLELGPEDSGSLQRPVRWQAAAGERPIVSGGRKLTGWQVDARGWWRLALPEVAERKWNFTQLFVGGHRRYRPRLPKSGWARIAEQLDPTPEEQQASGANRFRFRPGEFRSDWTNLSDVEVHVAQFWTSVRMPIREVDQQQNIVTLAGYTRHNDRRRRLATNMPYVVENIAEELGQPGEWYLDRPTGELTYVPLPGEDPQTTEVFAPRLRRLVVLRGDTEQRRWVQHLRFHGIAFEHTACLLREEGMALHQAEVQVFAAIGAEGARDCRFERCTVQRVGGWGIELGLACKHNVIDSCEVSDLGAGGIKLGLAVLDDDRLPGWTEVRAFPDDPDLMPSHNEVRNCLVMGGGRCHMSAVGVWIGNTPDNKVLHNRISDFYYSGVSVGWLWQYHEGAPAQRNEVGWNHIHDIGRGVLADMGGIYTLSICPGTVLHHNLIHDIHSRGYGGWGIYFDQATTDLVARDNVVFRTKDGSFNQHWGRRNRLENNIFYDSLLFQIRTNHVSHQFASFLFHGNVVAWKRGALLGLPGRWEHQHGADFDRNCYWQVQGKAFDFDGRSFDQWQKYGQDLGGVIADPGFADVSRYDLRLGPNEALEQIGFDWRATNATIERAGRLGSDRLAALPALAPAWPVSDRPDADITLDDLEM